MWPGPYGEFGLAQVPARQPRPEPARGWGSTTSTSSTRTASTRTRRSRRPWARSPRRCSRARRSTSASPRTRREKTAEAAAILREMGVRLLIHQPSYSMLNRWIEPDLLDVLGDEGIGAITFSPLAQGMLTDKYLDGIPEGSRATREDGSLSPDLLTDEALDKIRALNEIAGRRGQTLAQMALAWTLRDARVTSTLIGASSVAAARGERRPRSTTSTSATTSSPRSTATRPTAASTSGPARARASQAARRSRPSARALPGGG